MMKILSNKKVSVQIADHGAELISICANGKEYLWQGNPKYWGRRSPILFPLVGKVWDNQYRHKNKIYEMGQHGFARDSKFKLCHEKSDTLIYTLESNTETLKQYPFHFILEVGYHLKENRIEVTWNVLNTDSQEEMYFQIGAHPAFYYRNMNPESDKRGYLNFGSNIDTLEYLSPSEKGCVPATDRHCLTTDKGWMELTCHTFNCDTYIFDNNQLRKITLTDTERKPYLSLEFNSPLVAIWSPSAIHPDVPFVCIEPWYGRCDCVEYHGEFKDREWMLCIAPGKSFQAGYTIILEDVK